MGNGKWPMDNVVSWSLLFKAIAISAADMVLSSIRRRASMPAGVIRG
jgi:hypothetical protein